ncbi:MAG: N-acetylmuramoyl-L-alanine amidase [Spirochaetes bacterium]|nr:N-acetylmuramoyl-L-alanine amidase [Spirochaetota bacterium]
MKKECRTAGGVAKSGFRRLALLGFCFLTFALALPAMSLDEALNSLRQVSGSAGAPPEFRWDPFFREGVFRMGEHWGTFSTAVSQGESGFLMFDNREVFSVLLPYHSQGELVFPEAFVATLSGAFARYFVADEPTGYRIAAIVIDAGHGGRDPGAISRHVIDGRTVTFTEKDIVLAVSREIGNMLSRTFPDKRIILTRETDVFLTLDERVEVANSVPLEEDEAIIYISIHANYSFNRNARGFEVYYLNPNVRRSLLDPSSFLYPSYIVAILDSMLQHEFMTQSIILAQLILRGMGESVGGSMPSRGLKNANWFVVRNSHMPAVLVELGFLSNREDALLMSTEEGLRNMAAGVYKGIVDFVRIFEGNVEG